MRVAWRVDIEIKHHTTPQAREGITSQSRPHDRTGDNQELRAGGNRSIDDLIQHSIDYLPAASRAVANPTQLRLSATGFDATAMSPCDVEWRPVGEILLWAYSVGATPGSVEQSGVFVGLSSRRSRVQIPSFPPTGSLRGSVREVR